MMNFKSSLRFARAKIYDEGDRGLANSRAKEVRILKEEKKTNVEIADLLGISKRQVGRILNNNQKGEG